MTKRCANCVFGNKCPDNTICDDYYPVYDGVEDEEVEEFLKKDYQEFMSEWFDYIGMES